MDESHADFRFPILISGVAFSITIGLLLWLGITAINVHRRMLSFKEESLRLAELQGEVLLLHEILASSVYMAALTAEPRWEARYRAGDTVLSAAIGGIVQLTQEAAISKAASEIEQANRELNRIEYRVFDLIEAGQLESALALLDDSQVEELRQQFRTAVLELDGHLEADLEERMAAGRRRSRLAEAFTVAAFLLLVVTWVLVVVQVNRWRRLLHANMERRIEAEAALQKANEEIQQHARTLEAQVEYRTQDLERSLRAAEEFNYSIAHNLRAPIRAMRGFTSLLEDGHGEGMDPELRKFARAIDEAADRMDAMIQDLLELGRLDYEPVAIMPVDLDREIAQMLQPLQKLIQTAEGSLEIAQSLPRVLANPGVLKVVMRQLVENATKFHKPGEKPRIRIGAEQTARRVRLYVQDFGIGIEAKYFSKLFKPFEKLHNDYPGTGIGLAIVRKGAERMGGSVGVMSDEGATRFWIELPAAPKHDEKP